MQGRVLGFDSGTSEGMISADDGRRYAFDGAEWKHRVPPQSGQNVDFEADLERARAIYPVGRGSALSSDKNRITAALLAFFLGSLGFHKFYLGRTTPGIIMLVSGTIGWFFIVPGVVVCVIGFIECIIYLVTPDEAFQRKYVEGDAAWF